MATYSTNKRLIKWYKNPPTSRVCGFGPVAADIRRVRVEVYFPSIRFRNTKGKANSNQGIDIMILPTRSKRK